MPPTAGMMRNMSMGAVVFGMLICGVIAAVIGQRKNFHPFPCFLLGAITGVIGIAIIAVQSRQLPKAPPGLIAVKCPRCNAVQNVPDAPTFQCWQCKQTNDIARLPATDRPRAPEDVRTWFDRTKDRD